MTAARLDSVSKLICELGHWDVSNLKLQKILYLLQMQFMGENQNARLVNADFEAWDFGPVEPRLYSRLRMFGADPVQDVFYEARPFRADDARRQFIKRVSDKLLPMRAADLVNRTHWNQGAWAANYVPGIRGIRIPDADIAAEYTARLAARNRSRVA